MTRRGKRSEDGQVRRLDREARHMGYGLVVAEGFDGYLGALVPGNGRGEAWFRWHDRHRAGEAFFAVCAICSACGARCLDIANGYYWAKFPDRRRPCWLSVVRDLLSLRKSWACYECGCGEVAIEERLCPEPGPGARAAVTLRVSVLDILERLPAL